jgi:hypothetical protein
MSKEYLLLCLVFFFVTSNLFAQEFKPDVEVFGDYTYDLTDGKKDYNSFNIKRAYFGFKGNFYKNEETKFSLNFRVTTDIAELSDIAKKDKYDVNNDNTVTLSGSKYNGYYGEFLKYAFIELENPFVNGLKIVIGQNNVPWVGFEEGMAKTRWLGPVFSDKEKKLSSTDRGLSILYKFPSDFGDMHFSVVNGEGYNNLETSKDKDFMLRLSIRPLPFIDAAKGLMLHGYYGYGRADIDKNGEAEGVRKREIIALSYDYQFITLMGQYLRTLDGKDTEGANPVEGSGYSIWARLNLNSIFEINESGIFVRYDSFDPDKDKEKDAHSRIILAPYYYVVNDKVAFALQFQNESYEDSNVKPVRQLLFNMLAKY